MSVLPPGVPVTMISIAFVARDHADGPDKVDDSSGGSGYLQELRGATVIMYAPRTGGTSVHPVWQFFGWRGRSADVHSQSQTPVRCTAERAGMGVFTIKCGKSFDIFFNDDG